MQATDNAGHLGKGFTFRQGTSFHFRSLGQESDYRAVGSERAGLNQLEQSFERTENQGVLPRRKHALQEKPWILGGFGGFFKNLKEGRRYFARARTEKWKQLLEVLDVGHVQRRRKKIPKLTAIEGHLSGMAHDNIELRGDGSGQSVNILDPDWAHGNAADLEKPTRCRNASSGVVGCPGRNTRRHVEHGCKKEKPKIYV
jgi:hypothetical protein